jgi:hypothetical protein
MKLIFNNMSNAAVLINDICGVLTKWHNAEKKIRFRTQVF